MDYEPSFGINHYTGDTILTSYVNFREILILYESRFYCALI